MGSTYSPAGFTNTWRSFDGGISSPQREWSPSAALVELTPEFFSKFQVLIFELSGVWISRGSGLIANRLSPRLRVTGTGTWKRYYEFVTAKENGVERERMVEAVTCGTPRFFRVPQHFEFLAQRLFPRYKAEANAQKRARRLRVWSAGCGAGEEPFSLAMLMCRCFPPGSGWELEVLASDVSDLALQRARAAVWPVERSREIPQDFLEDFMLKGEEKRNGEMTVSEDLRETVRFGRLDLLARRYPVRGLFDLIFCRGVLDFFDSESRARIAGQLAPLLLPAGFLIVDEGEDLTGAHPRLKALAPSIFGWMSDSGNLLYDFRTSRP